MQTTKHIEISEIKAHKRTNPFFSAELLSCCSILFS